MKRSLLLGIFTICALHTTSLAENVLMQVYQPTSLLGTELDGDPLGTGESMAATIVSRPVLVGGAYPESPVSAVSLPHRIAGARKEFPDESNLIVLIGANVHAEYGEKEHKITADFSQSKIPANLGVTLYQVMQMTALCLQKTLGDQQPVPIRIFWVIPAESTIDISKLPTTIG